MKGRQIARYEPSGIIADAAAILVPDTHWTGGRDVVFRDHPTRVNGWETVGGTALFPPLWLLFARTTTGDPIWIYAGVEGVAVWDGAAHADITPASWTVPAGANPFTGGTLNGVPVLSNGAGVWYWPGSGLMLPLPGWASGDTAYAVRPYKYHLIAMGINTATAEIPELVRWSAAAAPGEIPPTWAPAPDNEAGSFALSASPGGILDGATLRQSFIVYKNSSCYALDYVGGAQVMTQRVLFREAGLLCRNGIAEMAAHHVVMTDSDILIHDGNTVRSLCEGRVRRAIFNNADTGALRNSFLVFAPAQGELWACVPETGYTRPNVAWIWNLARDKWGSRALAEQPAHIAIGARVAGAAGGASWDSDGGEWKDDPSAWDAGVVNPQDQILGQVMEAVPGAQTLYAVDVDVTRGGAGIAGSLTREGLGLGEPNLWKTVKRVWIEAQGTAGTILHIRLGGTDNPNGAPTYGPARPFVIGQDQSVCMFASGRWFGVQIQGDATQTTGPWRIVSFGLEYEGRGLY